jgi:hypothetical protein
MTRRTSRLGLIGITLSVLWLANLAVTAQQPPVSKTYILSQAICQPSLMIQCMPQQVPRGASVQIQLPGNQVPGAPPQWSVASVANVTAGRVDVIPSAGRIPDTNVMYLFSFATDQPGQATITMQAKPPLRIVYPGASPSETRTFVLDTLTYNLIVE